MSDTLSTLGFSTPAMDEIFSPGSLVERMARFEAALALALADTGLAPVEHAHAIEVACNEPFAEPEAILATTWSSGTPVIALVEAVKQRLSDEEERGWVHHGATSQDVVDTANMVLAREALEVVVGSLDRIALLLRDLVVEHRDQPQIGRTFLQNAIPSTFGMRAATWLAPVLDRIVDLRTVAKTLPVQLGGPVGNLAAYGDRGPEVVAAIARRLQLRDPLISWHTDRSVVWKLAFSVEAVAKTLEKIATDVSFLAAGEVGEISTRSGGSSSMPGKANPIDAIRALACASVCRGSAGLITNGYPHELDRGLGSWHAEWVGIPLMFRSAGATCDATESMLESMIVHGRTMTDRVEAASPHAGDLAGQEQIDVVLKRFDAR